MNPKEITSAIQRLALDNGGKPLGERLFLANAGLSRSALWSSGFSNYSDALVAAGFSKNQLNSASQPKVVLASLVDLIRSIGRFPTKGHIKVARAKDKSFPSYEAFLTVAGGAFSNLPSLTLEYCQANGMSDIEHLIPRGTNRVEGEAKDVQRAVAGYVYLVKHGQHYKIGRSNDIARRRREISLLPRKSFSMFTSSKPMIRKVLKPIGTVVLPPSDCVASGSLLLVTMWQHSNAGGISNESHLITLSSQSHFSGRFNLRVDSYLDPLGDGSEKTKPFAGRARQTIYRTLQRSGARRLRVRAPHEERPRLFRARHGAGERVVSNLKLATKAKNQPVARLPKISKAGKVLPSSTSRNAPPPVEM
jgi:hypothetical protein